LTALFCSRMKIFRFEENWEQPDVSQFLGRVARAFDRADITNIGVPRSCVLCEGGYDAQYRGVYRAQRSASHLQYASSALYQLNERRTKITFRDRAA
jgi:hypothetical protein